jgi:hypothetical protein
LRLQYYIRQDNHLNDNKKQKVEIDSKDDGTKHQGSNSSANAPAMPMRFARLGIIRSLHCTTSHGCRQRKAGQRLVASDRHVKKPWPTEMTLGSSPPCMQHSQRSPKEYEMLLRRNLSNSVGSYVSIRGVFSGRSTPDIRD